MYSKLSPRNHGHRSNYSQWNLDWWRKCEKSITCARIRIQVHVACARPYALLLRLTSTLCGICYSMILSVVIVLTVIGTCYEVSLQRKRNRWYRKHQASVISNNNEGDMKIITPLEKLPSLEMKIENGYSVKNNSNTSIPESNYSGGGTYASTPIRIFPYNVFSDGR